MRKVFISLTVVTLFLLCTFLVVQAFRNVGRITSNELQQDEKQEWVRLRKRFTEEHAGYISGSLWGLTHGAESKNEMEETLNLLQVLGTAMEKNDPSFLNEIGGIKGFKESFLKLMKSSDDIISGFAATVLAISGDLSYAPQIAAIVEKRDKSFTDESVYPPVTARGRAATALGLLGAKKYTKNIVQLLQSKNRYDRAGAAIALGYLGAKEHAQDVVNLLWNEDFRARDDDTPIYSLMKMGVAENYKKEIAQTLGDRFSTDVSKTAAYALAHLRAKEYAKDIAKLLAEKYKKGDAAKALAIMGAKEYAGDIALMLNDESSLNQKDALLALGVLKAKEYAPEVAKLLKAKDFVRLFAAISLVLMEASVYAKDVVPIIKETPQSGANFFLDASEFHPLVKEEALELNNRFKAALAQMESQKE